jgi:hypothetical protein
MKIELTPENSAVVAKYAELTGQTPSVFLNRYLRDNMVALFENPRSGELESHLGNLEYRTRAAAERVVAWMETCVERSSGAYWFEAEILQDPETGRFRIDTTATAPMRKMAIFSLVIFLTISSLLLCSCSDVDQGQGPSHESHFSKIPGSGAVSY